MLAISALAIAMPRAQADSLTATEGAYWFDPHETGTDRSDNYVCDDALLTGDSREFSCPLASMSFELAVVSFSSEREENTPEGYRNKSRNLKAYLEDNGFSGFDVNEDYKEKMSVRSMGVACAHKRIPAPESETGETTVLAIVPWCAGYEAEWGGNFVMGESNDHAGFAHGKDKVLEFASQYIETNGIACVWTGRKQEGPET